MGYCFGIEKDYQYGRFPFANTCSVIRENTILSRYIYHWVVRERISSGNEVGKGGLFTYFITLNCAVARKPYDFTQAIIVSFGFAGSVGETYKHSHTLMATRYAIVS